MILDISGNIYSSIDGYLYLSNLYNNALSCSGEVVLNCKKLRWIDANLIPMLGAITSERRNKGLNTQFVNIDSNISNLFSQWFSKDKWIISHAKFEYDSNPLYGDEKRAR